MTKNAASQYQGKRRSLDANLTRGDSGVLAQSAAMIAHNFTSRRVTCRRLVQQERRYSAEAPVLVLRTRREEVQHFLHTLKLEILKEALLEGRRRIDAQLGAHHCFERQQAHLRSTLRLILPEAGMPGAPIGAARARR